MVAAGFDSPDRVFSSGGHAMWLSGPRISGNRFENELCAHSPMTIQANMPITVKALIIGGKGADRLYGGNLDNILTAGYTRPHVVVVWLRDFRAAQALEIFLCQRPPAGFLQGRKQALA